MRRLGVSRRDLFLELDRPALKELPAEPYEYAEWRVRRGGLDYHVDIDGHFYSGPHPLNPEQLAARITPPTNQLFRKGENRVFCNGYKLHKFVVTNLEITPVVRWQLAPANVMFAGSEVGRSYENNSIVYPRIVNERHCYSPAFAQGSVGAPGVPSQGT